VDRGILFAGAVCVFIGLTFINFGLTREKSGPGVLMKNFNIVLAYIIQIAFFHNVPDVTSIVGAVLILSGIILVTVEKFVFTRYRFEM
jgi:drug/metabolite transporter (DMT)-like permease